jgi:S-adenosylmethionine hydrolase
MKGIILGINPDARLVDISHGIQPQNIQQAAFVIGTAYPYFPRKTIHLVVVDPAVGTDRRAIILRAGQHSFVAPDNGVLSYVVQEFLDKQIDARGQVSITVGLKPDADIGAVSITNRRYFREAVSPTFHGRDVFAPVAAALSLGYSPLEFGQPVTSVQAMPMPRPDRRPDGSLEGHVIYADGFGNLITDVRAADLPSGKDIRVEVKNQVILGLCRTYAEGSGLLALIGSSGHLEVALKGGSAASLLDAHPGDEVRLITRNA